MSNDGWPGHKWLEGRTIVHLKDHQPRPSHMPRGPAAKTGEGFLNPAMAPARTRSVMLLADALENDWLVSEDKIIRALDALCATGVRPRRWRREVPHQDRLRITANDLDEDAIEWGKKSHSTNPVLETFNVFRKKVDSLGQSKEVSRMAFIGLMEMRLI